MVGQTVIVLSLLGLLFSLLSVFVIGGGVL
jgi:hypothetical protein